MGPLLQCLGSLLQCLFVPGPLALGVAERPWLIGYLRALLYVIGFAMMDLASVGGVPGYVVCLVCYTNAFVLDVFDGMVARKLDQCSILGNVLDMVLDRSATAALLGTLAGVYPDARLYFAFLIALDVSNSFSPDLPRREKNATGVFRPGGHQRALGQSKNDSG